MEEFYKVVYSYVDTKPKFYLWYSLTIIYDIL